MAGKFITFEGGEGSGKSTQTHRLAQKLRARGITVVETREPGGSQGAEMVRHVLLSGIAKELGPKAEALLFAAARDDHLRELILPALRRGDWVISDRFADSTHVYQGIGGRVDREFLLRLEELVLQGLKPDLTVILDIPAEQGLRRAAGRRTASGKGSPDRFEGESLEFHERLRRGFLQIAEREPDRCVVIDATGTADEVGAAIWDAVAKKLDL